MSTGQITPADIEANIASEHYFTAEDGVGRASRGQSSPGGKNPAALAHLTYCVLMPVRGDPITAYSLAANPQDMNPAVERYIARQKAFNKLGELMAYAAKAALPDSTSSQTKGITP